MFAFVYSGLLRVIRAQRHLKRRIFRGPAPQWAADLYGLIEYVNVLGALPTLLALLFARRHVFKRLDPYAKSPARLLLSPIKFLTTLAIILIYWWHYLGIEFHVLLPSVNFSYKAPLQLFLLLAAVSAPVWVNCILLIVAGVGHASSKISESSSTNLPFLPALIVSFFGLVWPYDQIEMALQAQFSGNVRGRQYFWGLFYFTGFAAIVVSTAAQIIVELKKPALLLPVAIAYLVILLGILPRTLSLAYVDLLSCSARLPTASVFQKVVQRMVRIADAYFQSSEGSPARLARRMDMKALMRSVVSQASQYERRLKREHPDLLPEFQEARLLGFRGLPRVHLVVDLNQEEDRALFLRFAQLAYPDLPLDGPESTRPNEAAQASP